MANGFQDQMALRDMFLKVLRETNLSLISMDRLRLEELARHCEEIDIEDFQSELLNEDNLKLQIVKEEFRLLHCVLRETRANLGVLLHLHSLRTTAPNVMWQR